MAILDIFKKFRKKKRKIEKKPEVRPQDKKPEVRPRASRPLKTANSAWKVLTEPHVTEKATELEKSNRYVFKVFKSANKPEITKAVESLYGVEVVNVRIVNIPKKRRRVRRRTEGFKKGYKKAIVRLKEGDRIEIMPR